MERTEDFAEQLCRARACTDHLFRLVPSGSFYERPVPQRHRIIFYLGHLEAFDWNQICRNVLNQEPFHEQFDRLFAFGIDPKMGDLPDDQPSDWPSLEQVEAYARNVRERVDQALGGAPADILHVAVEHRLMHAETLCYMLHNLDYAHKLPNAPPADFPARGTPEPQLVRIPSGIATLGRKRGDGFGWDNEFDQHQVEVPGFAIDKYKVTNGDYLRFVDLGGEAPHFWIQRGRDWYYRGMFGEVPLPLDWPVYVSYEQACAYAAWAGKELPTEAQWHRAAFATPEGGERHFPWGDDPPDATRGNFDFHRWDPQPVQATPAGDSAFGVSQMLGNGMEWTRTLFGPFPGFQPFPFYPGYSADFFDDAHFVVKGASSRTAARLARRSFRNWFRSGYPYTYTGLRCVTN